MSPSYIDFQELKERFPIEKVVDLLGINMRTKSNQLRGACPACEGNDRTLAVTPGRGLFYCFKAESGGDALALIAHVRGCSVKDAARWLSGDNSDTAPPTKAKKAAPQRGEGFAPLDYLVPDHEAVEAVGFETEDAERIGIGYASRGAGRGSVMIPVRLSCGTLIGYVGATELAFIPKHWHYPGRG